MGINIFKKNKCAEAVFYGGHIYTGDEEFPVATAVACRDGKVMAVGDIEAMEHLQNHETELIDLEGKYMYPGFINVHSAPVKQIFKEMYFEIDYDWDKDSLKGNLIDFVDQNPSEEVYFGYGYRENIWGKETTAKDIAKELDEVCSDKAVVLLCENGLNLCMNSLANKEVVEAAEEEGIQIITAPYILDLFMPLDAEGVEENFIKQINDFSEQGFTSLFNLGTPDYFDNTYQSMLMDRVTNTGMIPQRFNGTFYLSKQVPIRLVNHKMMELSTNCIEIKEYVDYKTLNIKATEETFDENFLKDLIMEMADKGIDIYSNCLDKISTKRILLAYDKARSAGYKNISLTICSKYMKDEELLNDIEFEGTFNILDEIEGSEIPLSQKVSSTQEYLEQVTSKAAEVIGKSKEVGSIEVDKCADFTIFDRDILTCGLKDIKNLQCSMTVVGGQIAYDEEGAAMEEMYEIMQGEQY